jgi:uncharacterized membrane protein
VPIHINPTFMATIILLLFYVFSPLLILYLCRKYRFVNKIGAIVIAYAVGFVLGNIRLLPLIEGVTETQDLITTLTIPIAIPLLLFSLDIRKWFKIAGKTLLSMAFALFAAVTTVLIGFFIFSEKGIESLWDVSGMLIGLYTGGTPNLASIKLALGADETNYMIIATYDVVIGAFHLLFVMTIAQRLFQTFLPKYKYLDPATAHMGDFDGHDPYQGMLSKRMVIPLLKAFVAAVLIFAIGGATTLVVPESSQMAVVIIIITTLGIAASLIPAINKIEKSFELGMYLILIFCMVIASMADLSKIDFASLMIGGYVALVIFGSIIIQAILSKIFKVDADTFIITSTAFICSPPFVPVVAGALKNREIIFSGLSVGIIGYAVGNYLGVLVSYILERL